VHPRRPPAHKSVSLRHSISPGPQAPPTASRPQHRGRIPSSDLANPSSSDDSKQPSSADSKPEHRKESSGESSNADKWFERSNNQVKANASNLADNDPPFFLRHSSSSETPPDIVESRIPQFHSQPSMLPYRNSLLQMEPPESSSEEFRSVIDDLTVQNKKLKRKLRKYEKLYDTHLQHEKLFEIRVHGLHGAKKRELEETLRKFAMSLDESSKASIPTIPMATSNYTMSTPALEPQIASSSGRNSARFADSAYVSNSASGQHSLASATQDRTGRKESKDVPRDMSKATLSSRNQDIQSYLHDIPAGLLPRQPVAMSEKSKRKLVVRRLERIFAGGGAAIGGHQQPEQQQEVSQSAAHADRVAREASGQHARAEGLREARIMMKGDPADNPVVGRMENAQDLRPSIIADLRHPTGKDSPEQRPTRPLDLDLHRAQVPSDNIEYIRHLGFSPADIDAPDERDEGHGWIYLNVLTNMAQLHTLNVTADFVKKSVNDYSHKLQISRDGRKVRWKGGHGVTRSSSDSSPDTGTQSPSSKGKDKSSSKKKPKLERMSSDGSSDSLVNGSQAGSSRLAYVPLFFHKQDSEGYEETSDEHATSWDSRQQEQAVGNSSGFTSSGMRTNSSKRKRGDDGPIIFYNNAKFCTDLSGDPNESQSSVKYDTLSTNPVGMDAVQELSSHDEANKRRRPLTTTAPEDPMSVDDEGSGSQSESEDDIKFSPKSASSNNLQPSSLADINFEVSGLGGVQPMDNFKIEVQSRRTSTPGQAPPNASHFPRHKPYPRKIMEILREGRSESQPNEASSMGAPPVEQHVVSTRQEDLPASVLPPPALLFDVDSPEDDSDNDTDSGAESDVSSLEHDDGPPPSTVPQMLHFSSNSSDGEEEDEDDEMSDGSLDLLATARELDPTAVHEKARDYNATLADQLADEIPAG
ncbi:hypothetical protein NA57DRAFT_24090, partial [Rhizodiscina lignyota]